MGLCTHPKDVVDTEKIKLSNMPLIRRFSGGGTVIVDEDTLFTTFLLQNKDHTIDPYPQPVLEWVGQFYKTALNLPQLSIQESDYVLANRKVAGNAQYFRKSCFLHHTSFLHDYQTRYMSLLKMPKRQPVYRDNREHHQFLTTLRPLMSKEDFQERIMRTLEQQFDTTLLQEDSLPAFGTHRQTTLSVVL